MPSSLVFTALVVSWLAVLVPVVARRRQLVPRPAEADLCSRVLSRSGRAPAVKEVDVSHQVSQGRSRSGSGATALAVRERSAEGLEGHLDEEPEADLAARDDDRDLDDLDDLDERHDLDDVDELEAEHHGVEPKPYRPGRGGFDAEAARAAAEARYATRRRVALGLIALVVLSVLVALVLTSAAWWLVAATVVGLAGYLVFLRRQTRLEEELRERRIARLHGDRRELEARRRAERDAADRGGSAEGRETDDLDADDADGWDDDLDEDADEPAADDVRVRAVAGPRWAAPRTPAPPIPAGMELVADSDDDPAFHDLDDDRLPAYRRAKGA